MEGGNNGQLKGKEGGRGGRGEGLNSYIFYDESVREKYRSCSVTTHESSKI